MFSLARRSIETCKVTCFAANVNLKFNILLKIRYVYDFQKK